MTDALTVIEQPALPADLTATLELAADFAQNSKAPATRAAYERGSRSSFQRPFCGPVSQWPKRCLSGRQLERNHSMGIRGSRNNREYWWDPYRLLQFGESDFRIFESWCRSHGLSALPATAESLCGFLADEAAAGRRASTLG